MNEIIFIFQTGKSIFSTVDIELCGRGNSTEESIISENTDITTASENSGETVDRQWRENNDKKIEELELDRPISISSDADSVASVVENPNHVSIKQETIDEPQVSHK